MMMISRKKIWIAVAAVVVALALNVAIILQRTRNNPKWTALQADIRAAETQELSRGYRAAPVFSAHEYYVLIGALVKSGHWKNILSLAQEQASAITKLDELMWAARVKSLLADADYLDANPPSYREYLARSEARQREAILHAERMVTLGLLTEPQAAFVTQRYLSGDMTGGDRWNVLYNGNVQELLGMTTGQQEKVAQLNVKARNAPLPANLFTVDPEEQKQLAATLLARKQEHNAAAKGILTPSQLDRWSRLAAERSLPAEPPDLPALSDAQAARIKLEDLSPTFRALDGKASALGLSDDQKKLLKDLEEVTKDGLLWISLRSSEEPTRPPNVPKGPADRVSQTRTEFVKHAEQIAMLGILTQRQAEQLQAAIKKN